MMADIATILNNTDWASVADTINEKGYASIPNILTIEQCNDLIKGYSSDGFRKTVVMERHRFGLGQYKYYNYPLPILLQSIRESVYPKLAPVANLWMEVLGMKNRFPDDLKQLHQMCIKNGQTEPTVLILEYGRGGYNTLHQDLYGEIFFPFQLVLFLNNPETDYSGGEFVMTEQIPRSQSKAIVLKPKKGDMLIITTNFRPIKGNKGYYRANMRHGVSEVYQGQRHTVGIIFHDALQ